MYTFGERSKKNLETCHIDLQIIANRVIRSSKVDFGISEGHRSIERQKQLFDEGKSKIDGISKKGKHNYSPSFALDIYVYHPNNDLRRKMAYSKIHLAYIAGLFDACAKELFDQGAIRYLIRWGANWDGDGVIDFDQSFDDYPHFELINPAEV